MSVWTDEMKSAAMQDAQKVCDLTEELAREKKLHQQANTMRIQQMDRDAAELTALRSENERLRAALGGDAVFSRRFGHAYEKPCADPSVIACAKYECQSQNRCRLIEEPKATPSEQQDEKPA